MTEFCLTTLLNQEKAIHGVVSRPLSDVLSAPKTHPFFGETGSSRVYVIAFPNNLLKIGISRYVATRVRSISLERRSLGLSQPIGCVAATISHINAQKNERIMHLLWEASRAHGEYFNASYDEVLESLRGLTFRNYSAEESKRRAEREDTALEELKATLLRDFPHPKDRLSIKEKIELVDAAIASGGKHAGAKMALQLGFRSVPTLDAMLAQERPDAFEN